MPTNTEALASLALPPAVAALFASRHHRLHHALWHGLRDSWDRLGADQIKEIQALGWSPPRPAIRNGDGGWMPNTLNGSGVDFLFMHREMISEFDTAMINAGADPDVGWRYLPEPGRYPQFDVPPSWTVPPSLQWLRRRFDVVKSDAFYWSRMRWWDRRFRDHGYLRTITLGQLGSLLETSVHNDMHMRWSAAPLDPETGDLTVLGRPDENIDTKWDVVGYDFLGETYSSHVNPIFWRLHKWVDSIIDEWAAAHTGLDPNRLSSTTVGNVSWFASPEWIETDRPWSSPGPHAHHDVPTMEKVFAALFRPSLQLEGTAKARDTEPPRSWF